MQRIYEVADLPEEALDASGAFYAQHLASARAVLKAEGVDALAILLPHADHAHDDWRTALARDLARAHPPRRVNVVAGPEGAERGAMVDYLAGAPGVTGHYLAVHE